VKPGGRAAVAVWDDPNENPWATIPGRALVTLGHAEPPDPQAPGMFALAAPGRLESLLHDAGFAEVRVDAIAVNRSHESLDAYIDDTLALARPFREAMEGLDEEQQAGVRDRIRELAAPFMRDDGSVAFAGRTLVAAATA
jgi:hypothetical protein